MSRTKADWDFSVGHVQDIGAIDNFVSSESCVVLAGPSELPENIENLIPIGLVENATVTQNKQLQQLFEIGSRAPYFIPGRTFVQAGLTRVLFDGKSLLRALYENLGTTEYDAITNPDDMPGADFDASDPELGEEFFINLASSFFNKPLGLGFVIHDKENESWGGFYLEECYIQNHQFSVAANQTILLENAGLRASRVVPIKL
jgi:hypothetical protein